ncbi:MAG: NUDIX hydrolase [Planctomycetota bacterium]
MSRPHARRHRPERLGSDPTSWPRRQTASGLLVRGARILLERRPANARVTPGVWDTPGGHLRRGERPEAALRRELFEELGVGVERFRLAAVQDVRERFSHVLYRHFIYVIDAWRGSPRAKANQTLGWFTLKAALRLGDLNPPIADVLLELSRRKLA